MSNIDQNTKAVPQAVSLAAMLAASRTAVNGLTVKQEKAAAAFQDTSRKSTHNIAAEIYKLGRILLAEDNAREFTALLVANEITPRSTANPWTYVVALLGLGDTWKNRAPAFALMLQMRWDKDHAATNIRDFTMKHAKKAFPTFDEKLTGDRKQIDGLMFAARVVAAGPTAKSEDDFAKEAVAGEELDLSTVTVSEQVKFVLLWAKVDDGKVIPMGVISKGEGTAKKAAVEAGRALIEKPSSAAVEAVTEDIKGVVVFGDEVGAVSEPAIVLEESAVIEDATA